MLHQTADENALQMQRNFREVGRPPHSDRDSLVEMLTPVPRMTPDWIRRAERRTVSILCNRESLCLPLYFDVRIEVAAYGASLLTPISRLHRSASQGADGTPLQRKAICAWSSRSPALSESVLDVGDEFRQVIVEIKVVTGKNPRAEF